MKEPQDTHSSAFLLAALQLIKKSKHQANGTAAETAKLQHEGEPLVVLRLEILDYINEGRRSSFCCENYRRLISGFRLWSGPALQSTPSKTDTFGTGSKCPS